MSFELSGTLKVAALLGLVVALLAGAFAGAALLLRNHQQAERPGASTAQQSASRVLTVAAAAKPVARRVAVAALAPGLPGPLRSALHASREVVAVVADTSVAGDSEVVAEARAGAAAAHVGFAELDVRNDTVAAAVAAWAPSVGDPAVLVVGRPGTVRVELDGYSDRTMVAQAALDAR